MQANNIVIMFHTHTSWARAHNTRSGLHTFFGTVQYRKQIIRRAIILCVVAGIFLLVGSILTWLGKTNLFLVSDIVCLKLIRMFPLMKVSHFVKKYLKIIPNKIIFFSIKVQDMVLIISLINHF